MLRNLFNLLRPCCPVIRHISAGPNHSCSLLRVCRKADSVKASDNVQMQLANLQFGANSNPDLKFSGSELQGCCPYLPTANSPALRSLAYE